MPMSKERQEAARLLLKLRRAEESFLGFVQLINPAWTLAPFQLDLINTLDKLGKRTLKKGTLSSSPHVYNLMITMPPRHAKSTFSTVLFPAWLMLRNPKRHIMSTSYNAELARDFGRQVRNIFDDPRSRQAFDARIAQDARASDVWRTTDGGNYFGIGLGGTTTGRAANLLNIDDPVKTREEAESITMRNKVWDFYTASLTTRLQPEDDGTPAIQIVTLTRWHPDDLAGRIQQTEDWKEGRWMHLNYQAIQELKPQKVSRASLPDDDPDCLRGKALSAVTETKRYVLRGKKTALWPERFPLEDLLRRQRLNPRDFAALYQQQPYIEGGNILKTEWWRYYPQDLNPTNFQSLIITADTAFQKTDTADFSVLATMGLTHDGDIYVLNIDKGRWDFPDLKQRVISLNSLWRGKGLRAVYVEDKASGQSLIQELRRESGLAVVPYKVTRDKVSRVNAITPIIEGGRVFLPQAAPWLDDFVNEATAFPNGTHDDQVDAFTMGVDILSRQAVTPEALFGTFDASNSLRQQVNRHGTQFAGPALGSTFKGWGE